MSSSSPLGVCVFPSPAKNGARSVSYPEYLHDILTHAGMCYSSVSAEDLPEGLDGFRILLTIGEAGLADETMERIRDWVRDGGAWISVGGVCGMRDMLGVEVEPPAYSSWGGGFGTLGEGYLQPSDEAHPVLAHARIPLHYFGGIPVKAAGASVLAKSLDAHQRPTERSALLETRVGKGRCLLIAPDITGTVIRIQQGIGVTRDGVSAPDGTAAVCDNVLKSGDGAVLDWIFDREPVDGVPGFSAFLQPVADQWRELLIRAVLYMAQEQNVTLPVLWLYPRDLPALALLSHDTDGNSETQGRRMLEVVGQAGIKSTWCIIPPGYPPDLIGAVREAGHELAMHYDSMSDGTAFSKEQFDGQWKHLVSVFGGEKPVTNKNHYLRWEGDTEFFDWCGKRGIRLDQSKGASKTGEAGFNFGACHPYFPVTMDGRTVDVMEIPTITQDLVVFAPKELLEPMIAANLRHHGIMHLLFHPAHIEKPGVAAALLLAIAKAKKAGMEWWMGRQVVEWEHARRGVRWSDYTADGGGASVRLRADAALRDASVLWLTRDAGAASVNGVGRDIRTVERWGFTFRSVMVDVEGPGEYALEISC